MSTAGRPLAQRTIGVLGGASNVATGEYYKFLNEAANDRLGGWDIAETLVAGMNFGNIEALVRADDWDSLSFYLEDKVRGLKAGGADVLICVSNTLHRHLESIAAANDIPLIHIADPTGEAIKAQGLRRVALFGTRPVMEMEYLRDRYAQRFGLEIVVPDQEERSRIDQIIFDELVRSDIRESSRESYLSILDRLVADEGVEGVILGCTEIFLLLDQHHRPDVPMFNTTALHCRAAVEFALDPGSSSARR